MAFCTKCGAANADTASFCGACGAPVSATAGTSVAGATPPPAVPQVQKKSGGAGRVVLILLAAFFIGLPLLGLLIGYAAGAIGGDKKNAEDPCDEVSFGYLWGLQHGNSISADYWKPGVNPQNLIDVHSYKFVIHGDFVFNNKPYKIPRTYYQYEVESSTQVGIPIRKRWNVVMEPGTMNGLSKPCAIVQVLPAQ